MLLTNNFKYNLIGTIMFGVLYVCFNLNGVFNENLQIMIKDGVSSIAYLLGIFLIMHSILLTQKRSERDDIFLLLGIFLPLSMGVAIINFYEIFKLFNLL